MSKPNILFLLSDEHGFRYTGYTPENEGGEHVLTPNLDKLASRGTVFTNAYCQMPLCTPSRMCIFTGREARKCGAWENESILRPDIPTMGDVFEKAGYETCMIGKYHLGGNNQFGGFKYRPYGDLTGKAGHQFEIVDNTNTGKDNEVNNIKLEVKLNKVQDILYGDDYRKVKQYYSRTKDVGITGIPESLLQENIVCNETVAFLRENRHKNPGKPYFLCASFSRPHFPLTAPKRHIDRYWPDGVTKPKVGPTGDAYNHPMSVGMRKGFKTELIGYDEMMKARAAYFSCVSFLDEIIGDLLIRLEKVGLLENTIIIYTSDHGEMAGEHGVWWKNGWYEGCIKVPFILSLPEQRSKENSQKRINTPVQLIDIFPTLCGLMDIQRPEGLDGVDLSTGILGENSIPEDRPIFCDSLIPRWGNGTEFRMVRLKSYKYIAFRDAQPLMFNLDEDSGEQKNLIGSPDPEHNKIEKHFEMIVSETMDFDASEYERTVRDGNLHEEYKLQVEKNILNAYLMPDGSVVSADEALYMPNVIADDYKKVFI